MNPELAGFVGCCGNHAALVALSANDHGFPLELGIEQLFHGDEEGVHIDVEDRSLESAHGKAASHFTKPGAGPILEKGHFLTTEDTDGSWELLISHPAVGFGYRL
jgi:hypothetical protein